MATVLTAAAAVACTHPAPGTVDVSAADRKLTVKRKSVLLGDDVKGKTVSGCVNDDPNTTTASCKTVSDVSGSLATRLTVGGKVVLLDPLQATTTGTVGGVAVPLVATESQTKLTAT